MYVAIVMGCIALAVVADELYMLHLQRKKEAWVKQLDKMDE